MRVVVIADTHSLHDRIQVPDGDLVIHCGDALNRGNQTDLLRFTEWFGNLPHKWKLYVPGNHDWIAQEDSFLTHHYCHEAGITFLVDASALIGGLKIYGTPWTPTFGNWAFMKDDPDLEPLFQKIPAGLDILVTHGPAYGIRDLTVRGPRAGSRTLREAVDRAKPRYHFFGHIHEAYGTEVVDDTLHACASICTVRYQPTNAPMVFDIQPVTLQNAA